MRSPPAGLPVVTYFILAVASALTAVVAGFFGWVCVTSEPKLPPLMSLLGYASLCTTAVLGGAALTLFVFGLTKASRD